MKITIKNETKRLGDIPAGTIVTIHSTDCHYMVVDKGDFIVSLNGEYTKKDKRLLLRLSDGRLMWDSPESSFYPIKNSELIVGN